MAPTRIGDLIRVIDALDPDDAQRELIARLLPADDAPPATAGAGAGARRHAPAPVARPDGAVPAVRAVVPAHAGVRRAHGEPVRWGVAAGTGPGQALWWAPVALGVLVASALLATGRLGTGAWLAAVGVVVVARLAWWVALRAWRAWWRSSHHRSTADYEASWDGDGDGPGAGAVALERARWQRPPAPAPLVRDGQQRAVATLLAGRQAPGDVDLQATVRALAARRPLTSLPRRPRWSTNQGVHLHVDRGPAFEPFRHDVERLREELDAIASSHAVVELAFRGDPTVVTGPQRLLGDRPEAPLADHLPPSGTPVLVVTDLGIGVPRLGSPTGPAAFLAHDRLLRLAGCSVRYLVPYPPGRWPAALRGLPILHWSDDLGATDVLAGLRRRGRRR